ncbi:MAG: hypothetical protein WCW16_00115 [Candidatus Magasanikbacteria bacterium]
MKNIIYKKIQNFLLWLLGLIDIGSLIVFIDSQKFIDKTEVKEVWLLYLLVFGVLIPFLGICLIASYFLLRSKQNTRQKLGKNIGVVVSGIYIVFLIFAMIYYELIGLTVILQIFAYTTLIVLLLKNKFTVIKN